MGSAVNPVLREGNSDRRAPKAVKDYAKKHPHSMGAWSADSKTSVASMDGKGDFFSNEKSVCVPDATDVKIEFIGADGTTKVLKESTPLKAGEILDATFMSKAALVDFLDTQIAKAKADGVLLSLHMKATMMKVSDPIIFGHAVEVFFKDLIAKHAATLKELGVDFRNGFGDLVAKLDKLPADKKAEIEADIQAAYQNGPGLSMVNSDKGITNLHVPSDVIVDASMPAMIRAGGKVWDAAGQDRRHPRRHPGLQLRRHLSGDHRLLQSQRRARSQDHGLRPQRRPDGPGRRGIRLAQQDLRSARERYDARRRCRRKRPALPRGRSRRHLARLPDQGRPRPGLGEARRQTRPRFRRSRRVLARQEPRPRRPDHRQGRNAT
jgi:hypothetical protein